MKTLRQKRLELATATLGICLLLCGMLCWIFSEPIFNELLYKMMRLHPNSKLFEMWKSPPVDLQVDLYFYNWTNPEDFDDPNSKPKLQQVGPYRFLETSDKFDIGWHPNNASVSYQKRSYYRFDANGSRGSLSDEIVTLNVLAVTAAMKVNRWTFFRRYLGMLALNTYNNTMSLRATADELLFTGNDHFLLNVAKALPMIVKEVFPFDRFGYLYQRNGSADFWGRYNMHTGADDINKFGHLHTWNYKSHSGKFKSYCGMVNGTAGEFQQPNLKANDTISYFVSDMCRSVTLDFAQEVELDGVKGYKYTGGLRSVDNGTLYPENKCFYADPYMPSGIMNISTCWFDTPLYTSYPHFYNADPHYVNAVEGLSPNKDKHELYVVLEPRTGLTLELAGRMQLNALVAPIPGFRSLENVPRIVFPIMWIEEKVRMPPEIIADFKLLSTMLVVGKIMCGFCFCIGLILTTCYLRGNVFSGGYFVNFHLLGEKKSCHAKTSNDDIGTEMISFLEKSKLNTVLMGSLEKFNMERIDSKATITYEDSDS